MRLALRGLLNSPGYTVVALTTLALGIGVNTSMFSVVDTLLFRSAPFPESGRIAQILGTTPQGPVRNFSEIEIREIRPQTTSFVSLTVIGRSFFALSEPGQPAERISGVTATADLFATLGVQPLLGRAFTVEETQPGRNGVVLISHSFWQQRFGGSQDIIGRTLRLDGENVTIIGVMPASFEYRFLWGRTALWRPLNYTKDQLEWRDYKVFQLIGRLRPDVMPARAAAELAPVALRQEKEHPQSYSGLRYRVVPLHEALMDSLTRSISWMLLGLSGFVLLIACANLANLQLARATTSMRDLAIRAALGASRTRLILQQLSESILLSLGGGVLGLLVAIALNRVLSRNILIDGTAGLELPIDLAILALTLAVSLLTGLVFGLVPAWFSSRANMNDALKQQSRGSTTGRGHHFMRQALIIGEVALALVLLGGAGIMERGFVKFLQRESGWDTAKVLTAVLPVPETHIDTDPKRVVFYRRLEDRLKLLPGVEHAAIATSLPVYGYNGERQVLLEGQTPGGPELPNAYHVMMTADYFATMGIPLVAGRLFAPDLNERSPRVIVVNEALARRLWPDRSPLGQRLGSMDSGKPYWAEVIGVVRDVESAASLGEPTTRLVVYKPLVFEPWSYVNIVLRSSAPSSLVDSLRRAVAEVDPDLPADQIGTVRQTIDQSQHNLVLVAKLLNGFALLGLALAAVGIYGVISNLVAQRTGEFGIRLALGARPVDVLTLVLNHGLRLTVLGLVLGLGGAYALGRMLNSMMPRLASPDPLALATVSILLFAVSLLACWIPSKRATKVDPLVALRAE
jgi:predicted permease